jgi:hypothetical protein
MAAVGRPDRRSCRHHVGPTGGPPTRARVVEVALVEVALVDDQVDQVDRVVR